MRCSRQFARRIVVALVSTVLVARNRDARPQRDLAADTLDALGNKIPEKWEGLTIGPRVSDGSYVNFAAIAKSPPS